MAAPAEPGLRPLEGRRPRSGENGGEGGGGYGFVERLQGHRDGVTVCVWKEGTVPCESGKKN